MSYYLLFYKIDLENADSLSSDNEEDYDLLKVDKDEI